MDVGTLVSDLAADVPYTVGLKQLLRNSPEEERATVCIYTASLHEGEKLRFGRYIWVKKPAEVDNFPLYT